MYLGLTLQEQGSDGAPVLHIGGAAPLIPHPILGHSLREGH